MGEKENVEGMLSPYRVLDLTNEKGLLCGKVLGDMGADVIKVERPGGDPSRNIGPFYHDDVDPEKSLFWFAYCMNKRGITLNIETADGREIFKRLVKTADFVIESFDPWYLDRLGLGYSALSEINPRIILTSITPFGQTGPYAHYKASDMVMWAMGGRDVYYRRFRPSPGTSKPSPGLLSCLNGSVRGIADGPLSPGIDRGGSACGRLHTASCSLGPTLGAP